jgi:hypothetical protein
MGALDSSKKISDGTPTNITNLFKTIAASKLKTCFFPRKKPRAPIEKIGKTPFNKWSIISKELFSFRTI